MTKRNKLRRVGPWAAEKPGPWFKRKTYAKNSRLFWGAYRLGTLVEDRLYKHMRDIPELLHEIFNAHRKSLPRNSCLSSGAVYGSWIYCPNALADEVEQLIRGRHAEFLAAGYDEMDLFREITGKDAEQRS